VETLFLIKRLLYEERFTIEGAKARIREIEHAETPVKTLQEEGRQLALIGNEASRGGSFPEEFEKTKKELIEAQDKISELKDQLIIQKKAGEEKERAVGTRLSGIKAGLFEIMKICE